MDKGVDGEGEAQVAGGMYWRDRDMDKESMEDGAGGVRSPDGEAVLGGAYS